MCPGRLRAHAARQRRRGVVTWRHTLRTVPILTRARPEPSLIGHLTSLAGRLSPALARLPKGPRSTLGAGTWRALEETVFSVLTSVREPDVAEHVSSAAASFDLLKWYLHLLEEQKLVSDTWLAELGPDLLAVAKLLGAKKK